MIRRRNLQLILLEIYYLYFLIEVQMKYFLNATLLFAVSMLPYACSDIEDEIAAQLKKDKNLINQYVADNNLDGTYIESSIFKSVQNEGTGTAVPQQDQAIYLKYSLELLNGTVVRTDTIFYQHKQGFYFPGWETAIGTMKKDESALFLIPSKYAFGQSTGTYEGVTIPPNSVIVLDATVLDIITVGNIPPAYAFYNKLTGNMTSSGIFYTVDNPDTGESPVYGQKVTVNYKGFYLTGPSYDAGTNFDFTIGGNTALKGWEEAVLFLKKGGKGTFVLPSNLAFGEGELIKDGKVLVPANAVVVYEIELTNIE
jgi:FKBP-type peptidyl-prolyl cis-trans isomerase FkpA